MNIIKPTPSQAAVALKKFFARHNIDIKLSLAQEAIAVSNGYPNWNVLAADVPTREVKTVPVEGSEQLGEDGLQLWALSGRVHGADDDSLYMCWAHDEEEAQLFARMWLYDVTDPAGLPTEEEDIPIYINCSTLVGTIGNGRFCLSEALKPAALRRDISAVLSQPEPYMAPSPVEGVEYGPTLQELIDMNGTLLANGVIDEDDRLETIQKVMYQAALQSGLLQDWTYQDGRGNSRWKVPTRLFRCRLTEAWVVSLLPKSSSLCVVPRWLRMCGLGSSSTILSRPGITLFSMKTVGTSILTLFCRNSMRRCQHLSKMHWTKHKNTRLASVMSLALAD